MIENVALIKKKQKSFNSSVVKYKKLLKKGELKVKEKPATKEELKVIRKKKRGIVYVGNVPHGFYEEEMRDYFKQFGAVTRIRVCRSKKTGQSKGYAFIEFQEPDVGKIVAETMNNYLMDKRLLKAHYISPEEQENRNYFQGKNFTADKFPTLVNRKKHRLAKNAIVSEDKIVEKNTDAVKKLHKTIRKLKKLGIIYEFKPVDVPDYLTVEVELLTNDAKILKSDPESDAEDESELSSIEDSKEEEEEDSSYDFDDDIKQEVEEVPIKKEKLKGVTKSKTKHAKPSKLSNKKTNLIKTQISNKDQIKIKSPKKVKAMKKKSPKK